MKDFEILEWDSEFFGFKVAQIHEGANNNELLQRLHKENVQLAYYVTEEKLDSGLYPEYYDFHLVDQKVPLEKELVQKTEIHSNVSFYTGNDAEEQLIELAYHAGSSTRFKVDPNISENKYKDLFKIWIQRSVKKEIADFVLTYKINDAIVGFVAVAINENRPYASLLAVNPKFEGKGVAFALMHSTERVLWDKGYSKVYGATQLSNRKALVIYERFGLKRGTVKFVYHLWKK